MRPLEQTLQIVVCFFLYFFLWPLCSLMFFYLRILTTPLASSNSSCIICTLEILHNNHSYYFPSSWVCNITTAPVYVVYEKSEDTNGVVSIFHNLYFTRELTVVIPTIKRHRFLNNKLLSQ